jgi:hypothetical protein
MQDLTTCIFTHHSSKLITNGHLAPPKTDLLRGTILNAKKFAPTLFEGQIILFYDSTLSERKYYWALRDLCAEFNIEMKIRFYSSYRKVLIDAFDKYVNTKYYFCLEHDWWLMQPLDIQSLIGIMEEHDFVNYIRLWSHHDILHRFPGTKERWFQFHEQSKPDPRLKNQTLLTDTIWSCNPHLAKTEKYKTDWIERIRDREINPQANGNSGGIEEVLTWDCKRDFRKLPYSEAHRRWGLYVQRSNALFFEHNGI